LISSSIASRRLPRPFSSTPLDLVVVVARAEADAEGERPPESALNAAAPACPARPCWCARGEQDRVGARPIRSVTAAAGRQRDQGS
jgi:hypothetical protein